MAQTRGPLRQSLATEHCDRVSRRCKFSEANLFVFARMPMRTPMKSLVIAGLLSALMIGRAHAQVYYTYSEWDRLSDQARTMYIAGAYDSLVSIASPETASTSRHYSKCVSGRGPNQQPSKNGPNFMGGGPSLPKKPGEGGLIQYSIELWGAP